MTQDDTKLNALLAEGKHVEAARALLDAGDYVRARTLFEQVWDFRSAADCAEKAGDRVGALQNWLEAKALDEASRLRRAIAQEGDAQECRAAALAYEKKTFAVEAASLYETIGDNQKAAELFQQGGAWLLAGRVLEKANQLPAAGKLYERFLAEEPEGVTAASAHLALGKCLIRLGHHEPATRHLQNAARMFPPETHQVPRREARGKLIASLAALGLRSGAFDVFRQARADDPALPQDLDSYLRQQDDESPAAQAGAQGDTVVGGRYRLGELLGAGSVGRVFRARDLVTDNDVALKLLFSSTPNESYERFAREAKICGSVQHPNIVALLDFREDAGFFTMELLAGGTLRDRLDPRLSPAPTKRMALDIVDGLEVAHSRGIVHRDIKPANIFFDATGTAKLGDFGVAHLIDLGRTQTGGLIGTVAYMSPEQITAAPISFAADHYALGVTLFETLTGRLPFVGPDFVGQHLGTPSPTPSSVHPEIGEGWDEIIATLLQKDPEARFTDTHALKMALDKIDTGEGKTVLVLGQPAPEPARREPEHPAVPTPSAPRFHSHVQIGRTDISTLHRAVDTSLERTVVLEEFIEGHPDANTRARLLALGSTISPYVQHTLGFDPVTRTVIFESPRTSPIENGSFTAKQAVLLLMRTAQALAPVHAANQAHGKIDTKHVLVDDRGTPLLCTSGLGPAPGAPNTQDDVDHLLATAAHAIGSGDDLLLGLRDDLLDETLTTAQHAVITSAVELLSFAQLLHDGIVRCQRVAAHVATMWQAADTTTKKQTVRSLATEYGLSEARLNAIVTT